MKEEVRKFLEKANRTLQAAETLLRAGDCESAAGRCYYAMLHAAQAVLRDRDLRYRKHSGVHAAYGEHFAKTELLDPKSTTAGFWMPLTIGCAGTTTSMSLSTRNQSKGESNRPASLSAQSRGTWRLAPEPRPLAHRSFPAVMLNPLCQEYLALPQ